MMLGLLFQLLMGPGLQHFTVLLCGLYSCWEVLGTYLAYQPLLMNTNQHPLRPGLVKLLPYLFEK